MTSLIKNLVKNKLTVGLLVVLTLAFGVFQMASMARELTQKNYGFYGTHYDFIAFYSAATTIQEHVPKNMYDAAYMTNFQRGIIPHSIGATGYMPFLNPPIVAVMLAPLALMSINTARLVWLAITIVLSVYALYKLASAMPKKYRWLSAALLFSTFPIYQTLIDGQVTIQVIFFHVLAAEVA